MKDSGIGILKRVMIISIIFLLLSSLTIERTTLPPIEKDEPTVTDYSGYSETGTRGNNETAGGNFTPLRSHIRTFINGGNSDEFLGQHFDVIIDFAMGRSGVHQKPNNINLLYDYFGTMVPGDSNQKYQALLDYCDLHGLTPNDVEDMFLHTKEDVNYTLGQPKELDPKVTKLVPGWDPVNDLNGDYYVNDTEFTGRANPNASARHKNESRIPIYYWGPPTDYLMNIGNEDYLDFIVNYYAPKILDEKEGYDGLFLDTLRSTPATQGDTIVLEYPVVSNYTADIKTLLSDLKSSLPNGTIIIGNGWVSDPIIISGSEYESWARITTSIDSAKLDTIIDRDEKGIMQLIQYIPIYDEVANPNRPDLFVDGVTLERDQLYSLALYYLVHGNYTYYGYGIHSYELDKKKWFDAIDYDIGQPLGSYYFFDTFNETDNILINGDFEIDDDSDGNPDYWEAAEPVDLDPDIKYEGNYSVKIESDTEINNINRQYVTLEPNTTYTLSGWIKTENVTGDYGGANIYPYGFDDLQEEDPWIQVDGTTDWTFYSMVFTTGSDTEGGRINYRIVYCNGTAWFDDFHLTKGRYCSVFARDFQNATVLLKAQYNVGDNTTTAHDLEGDYRLLKADGTLEAPVNEIELMGGEGMILVREDFNITTSEILPDGLENLHYSFNFTAIGGKEPIQWSLISGSLPPGLTLDIDGTISGSPNKTGEYNFIIEVFDAFARTESKEFTLSIETRDLMIDNIILPKNPVFSNEEVKINITVYNIGNWTLNKSVDVQLYINNIVINTESIIINEETEKKVTFLWTAEEGLHNIMIKVDAENMVIESNESNNIVDKEFYIYQLPDLWISEMNISSNLIFETDKIFINSTLASYSELPLKENITVELLIDEQVMYTRNLVFGDNQFMNVSFVWNAVSGLHEIEILVDSSDILKEAHEDNNNKTTQIRVYTPPTVVSIVMSDPPPTKAGTVNFTITFSEDMETTLSPTVTFGQSSPYNTYTIIQSSYSGNTWAGTFAIDNATGDGIHRIRVEGAEDLAGNPMATAYISDPFEIDTTLPTSSVDALAEYQNSLTFDVPYTDNDGSGSGIKYVEMYYRKDSGSWTKFNSTFTSTPISFLASGEGVYEFYTIATDNAVNIEVPPTDADASTTVDTTSPTILSIVLSDPSPTKAKTVSYTITFSEDMDTTVSPIVTFGLTSPYDMHEITEYSYVGDTWTGTFDIDTTTGDGTYTIKVSVAEDLAGIQMATDTSYTFLIDTKLPEVASATPTGTDIAITTEISIAFNETMNHTSVQSAFCITDIYTTRCVTDGSFSWSGNTMTFTPDINLSYGTEYTIIIGTSAKDLAENGLALPYTWSFTTIQTSEIASPTVDYIIIRDESDGKGNVIEDVTFTLGKETTNTYYCAAYNYTAGYLGERIAEWTVTNGIGNLSHSIGAMSNFTALTTGTGIISANLFGIINSTGVITVHSATDMITISAPTNVIVRAISSNEIKIEWALNSEPNVVGYIIQRSTGPNGPWDHIATVDRDTEFYTDTNLRSNSIYYYRVIAVDNDANESPPSLAPYARTHKPEEFSWFWVLIIFVILVVLILVFSLVKKRKPEVVSLQLMELKKNLPLPPPGGISQKNESLPLVAPKKELPPPPPGWISEEEVTPLGEEEEPPPPEDEISEDELPPPPEDEIPEDELPPPDDEDLPLPEDIDFLEDDLPPPPPDD